MIFKEPALLYHEIPLFNGAIKDSKPEKIYVNEGDYPIEDLDNANFAESGGGHTFKLAGLNRVICWRSYSNTLELFEFSPDVDLHSNHFMIVFEDSKVLPSVHMSLEDNQLRIVCCTIRSVHSISIDVGNARRQQDVKPGQTYSSLLMNVTSNDFDRANNNYGYGTQIQGLASSFSAACLKSKSGHGLVTLVGLTMSTSNIVLVTMSDRGPPTHCIINHTSRISRLWSGLNPWAGSGTSDFASDIRLVVLDDQAFIAAVFKDCKFRMWCAETHELSATHDLNDQIPHINDEQGPFDFKIRARRDSNEISIYVGMADRASFLQLQVELNRHHGNGLILKFNSCLTQPLSSSDLPQKHLVDYMLMSENRLVVLWHDLEDVDTISIAKTDVGVWHDVAMYPSLAGEVPLQPYQDVRESYLDYLFTPGRFSQAAIARALTMHRRSSTGLPDHLSEKDLQERVSSHILQEIQNEMPEEGSEEIIDEIQERVWNTFFQTCLQYQQVLSRSFGLTTDSSEKHSMISVVHKGFVSVLCPVSSLEAVCRGSDPAILRGILRSEEISEQNLEDLSKLIECLGNLHDLLALDVLQSIHTNIFLAGNSPREVVEDAMPDILDLLREFPGASPDNLLGDVDDISTAIKMLLVCLEPSDQGHDFDVPDIKRWPLGSSGVELLARNVQLHIKNRFQLVTLLYILTSILDTIRRPTSQPLREDEIQLSFRVTSYVQCYQALFWLSTVKTQTSSSASLEESLHSLSVHDRTGVKHRVKNVNVLGHTTHPNLLEFFLATLGGRHLKSFLKVQKNPGTGNGTVETMTQAYLADAFHPGLVPAAMNYVMNLMFPMGPTLAIPDFLLAHGQHAILKRYLLRNLGSWCNWCPMSRAYLLGHCHLKYADYNKAVRSFILAASGISSEEYMMNKLLREDEDNLHPVTQEIIYYTRVLQMFEKMDLPEQVILLAQHALEEAKRHDPDPNIPILWSSIFRQNNNLFRHAEAFRAIVLNPDPDHKKDCLRTLVVSLCERSEYKTLIEFHYGELEEDLVSILEQRARSTDLSQAVHNYYDLLYAFHVHKKNFRRAAAIMYEQSYRLQCELSSVAVSALAPTNENLQRQLACLVTCLNCLHLVKPDNRWILHPISSQGSNRQRLINKSPKRHYDGEAAKLKSRSVVIKELPDIQKEAMVIEKRIKVEEISGKSVPGGNLVTSSELVSFLCHSGMFDDAILISSKFNLSIVPVFESLATKCVHLTFADDKEAAQAWDWLLQNETAKNNCTRGNKQSTIADEAYRLLQVYIDKYGGDKSRGSTYFYATAKSLLGLGARLPAWFVSMYKDKNSPELLRLLVCFDRLEEATSIAMELIDRAKVYVGIELYSNMKCRATLLPYTIFEQLLSILKEVDNPHYEEMYCALTDTLDDYLCTAETASQDLIRASLQY